MKKYMGNDSVKQVDGADNRLEYLTKEMARADLNPAIAIEVLFTVHSNAERELSDMAYCLETEKMHSKKLKIELKRADAKHFRLMGLLLVISIISIYFSNP